MSSPVGTTRIHVYCSFKIFVDILFDKRRELYLNMFKYLVSIV